MKLALTALVTSLFLFQCATEGGPDVFVDALIVPAQPLALDAPITVNPGTDDEIIYQPVVAYFSMRIKNSDKSKYHLAVAAIKVTYTNISNNQKVTSTFDGSIMDPARTFFASLSPGDDKVVRVDASDDTSLPARFYTGGLPKDANNLLRYRAEVELLGWYTEKSECVNDPCDDTDLLNTQSKRLNKKVFFSNL